MQTAELNKYIIYFLLVFLDLILIFIYLFRKKTKDNFTPELFFPIAYLSYYALGFIFIIEDVPLKEILLFLIGIAAYFGGILFANVIQLNGKAKTFHYSYNGKRVLFVYSAYFVIGLLSTVYVFSITGIPIFQSDINAARESVSEHAYIATLGRLLTVAFMVGFSYIFLYKGKHRVILLPVLSIIFLISILDGSRELPVSIFLMALFFFNYRVRPIGKKTMIKIAALIVILVVVISFYRGYALFGEAILSDFEFPSANPIRVMINILAFYLSNEFSVSLINFSQFIDLIPDHIEYQYGRLFLSPLLLPLPGEQKVPGAFVKEFIGGEWTGAGASATLIGIFYADGGVIGVIYGMLMVGCLLKALHRKTIGTSTNILWVGLYSFFLLNALISIRSNFTQGFDVIFIPILIAMFHFLTIKRKQSYLIEEGR